MHRYSQTLSYFPYTHSFRSTPGIDPDERSFSSLLNQVVSDKQLSVKEATLKFGKA